MAHDPRPLIRPRGHGAPDALQARESARRQMRLAAQFGRFAAAGEDMQGLLDEACSVAAAGLASEFAKLLVYRHDERGFVLQAGTGWRAGLVGHARLDADTGTAAGFAWHTGQSVVSNDIVADGRFRIPDLLADHGIGSSINVVVPGAGGGHVPGARDGSGRDGSRWDRSGAGGAPVEGGLVEDSLGEDGEAFGVLEVEGTGRGAFTTDDVCFLQLVAYSVSAAVARRARQALHEAQGLREALGHQASLREMHHRVRNDLQGLCSGLETEARRADAAQRAGFERMMGRVLALAGLYGHLLGTRVADEVDFASYLHALCGRIAEAGGYASRSIELCVEAQAVVLPRDRALQVAVAVNELVSNAAGHAFAGRRGGRITVGLLAAGAAGGPVVTVADDGSGFAGPRPGGSGLGFVERLVRQAGGTLAREDGAREDGAREDGGGTRWRIALAQGR